MSANSSGQAREGRQFERGVKESIYVNLEQPSFNRGGGLRHYLSATYNAVLSSLLRQLNNHSHLGSPNTSNPHRGRLNQSVSLHAQLSRITAIVQLCYSIRQLQMSEYTCR